MNKNRNLVTRLMMIVSVLLLAALQFLWLKNSYEKAYSDFRKESSLLLKNSVADLRDSLFVKVGEPFPTDSIVGKPNLVYRRDSVNFKFRARDSVQVVRSKAIEIDSVVGHHQSPGNARARLDNHRTFIIHLGPDTLDTKLLSTRYKKNLSAAGILLPFKIDLVRAPRPGVWPQETIDGPEQNALDVYSNSVITEPAGFIGPLNSYVAIFSDVKGTIVRGIIPQIVLSLLLTIVVLVSFIIIYRALRAQQKLNDLKNDFISNITHELKTPLATVSVALEALKDFHALDNPERTKEYIGIAQNELSRLSLMTDKILKATAFERQGIAYVPEKVNLHLIIQQVLSSLKLVFEKNNLQVAYTPTGKDFQLSGSEIHLTNVIYNLLDNALKYGNGQTKIDLTLTATEEHVDFAIKDFGIGIGKEYQQKIFEKFFRVPTGDVHNIKGYGLGLNYVAGVIQKHGGTINVESEIGKGSLFKIRLPK